MIISEKSNQIKHFNQKEIQTLLLLREQKKMSKDLMKQVARLYPIQLFQSVSQSEQRNFDMLKTVILFYHLDDPSKNKEHKHGVYTNNAFYQLYKNLFEESSRSVVHALKAFISLEEQSISEINKLLRNASSEFALEIYEELKVISTSNMKVLWDSLRQYGFEYYPKSLTEVAFRELVE